MITDCPEVGRALHLLVEPDGTVPAASSASRHEADAIVVPDSLADLAREMHLHLG